MKNAGIMIKYIFILMPLASIAQPGSVAVNIPDSLHIAYKVIENNGRREIWQYWRGCKTEPIYTGNGCMCLYYEGNCESYRCEGLAIYEGKDGYWYIPAALCWHCDKQQADARIPVVRRCEPEPLGFYHIDPRPCNFEPLIVEPKQVVADRKRLRLRLRFA